MHDHLLCNVLQAQLSSMISTIQRKIADCREQYDRMLAEDKILDKDFKRDFSDCEPYVDQLYKLFKRRPRLDHGLNSVLSLDVVYVCVEVRG